MLNTYNKKWQSLGAAVAICCSLSACQQPVKPASPNLPVVASPTPRASGTPGASTDAQRDSLFQDLTQRYEVSVAETDDGYKVLEPLLSGQLSADLGDDLLALSLDNAEEKATFDSHLLPLLTESFSRPYFVTSSKLEAGEERADFRTLRHLVNLLTTRADQIWMEGDKEKALVLARLPLQLSASMRNRPETVSVNLFSSSYSESVLALLPKWLESKQSDPDVLKSLLEMVENHAPAYSHLQETVSVDFAQLSNSLQSEKGRENLGVGQLEDSTLKRWLLELDQIYLEAAKLYTLDSHEARAFNERVMKASTLIQGLVIDYPQVATMQRHSFAKYKATELGLALVGTQSASLKALSSEEKIERVFASQPENVPLLKNLLTVEDQDRSLRVVGKGGKFDLLAPGVSPIFFEFHPGL